MHAPHIDLVSNATNTQKSSFNRHRWPAHVALGLLQKEFHSQVFPFPAAACWDTHTHLRLITYANLCLLGEIRGITHGFMLKISFPTSGFSEMGANPLSVQEGEVGPVGLVGKEVFFLWISCTCFRSETATDWERDATAWQGRKDKSEWVCPERAADSHTSENLHCSQSDLSWGWQKRSPTKMTSKWYHYLIVWSFWSFLHALLGTQPGCVFTSNGPTRWVSDALDL